MGRIRGAAQSREGFAGKIRDIVAEKGTAAAAQKYGRSESTIKSWANGTSAPNRYDDVIQKVNRSYSASKPRWEPEKHQEKVERVYGTAETYRTGSIMTYMKVLESNGYNLSKPARQHFTELSEEGNVVSWKGNTAMPVSDVRIIPAMSDPKEKVTGGIIAFGLTNEYFTGHKGKRQEKVRGIVTQTITRNAFKTMGNPHKYPDKMTPEELHETSKQIHLESKVNAQRLPAIYLGYADV
jgi:hypothetical protein